MCNRQVNDRISMQSDSHWCQVHWQVPTCSPPWIRWLTLPYNIWSHVIRQLCYAMLANPYLWNLYYKCESYFACLSPAFTAKPLHRFQWNWACMYFDSRGRIYKYEKCGLSRAQKLPSYKTNLQHFEFC